MFSTASFLPHESCYLFNRGLILLHAVSDSSIALAYYAIPLELLYFARRRRDLPFRLVFAAFGVFILGCGTTHLMEVITLWYPVYWVSGTIKAITAIASVATAVLTFYIIPQGLALRSPAELEDLNRKLKAEINERRQAEAEVIRSREALVRQERIRVAGQLASGIAHDLNNTLNVVRLRLNIIGRDPVVQNRHADGLHSIDRAIEDAARTVARVQELAKPRGTEDHEPVELQAIVSQALELARTSIEGGSLLRGRPVLIESNLPESLPAVKGQASDLRQVFLNLLINASDATSEGKIKIESTVENGCVVVRVLDEGTGIAPDELEQVFEPFYTTKGARGTGLGLSIAREVMEGLGGSIKADNLPGRGAVFILQFPIASAAPAAGPVSSSGVRGCRFLLVDDDEENLKALRGVLITSGHQADTANSGAAALEKLSDGAAYDVILCDLGMPVMNGWETARRVLKIKPSQPFYLVTGWGQQIEPAQTPVAVSGIISKPIDPAEIDRIVAQLG
jgi:signal transduction histidine kinase/CheY-like chemotaxis protein